MDQIPAAVILLLVWLGALAIVAEVALPTLGILGAAGAGLWGLGIWAANEQGLNVVPLLLVMVPLAFTVWAIMTNRPMGGLAVGVALAFAACGLWFAAASKDWPTGAISIATTAAGVPILGRVRSMAQRLMQAAPTTGAESLLGLDAEVLEWSSPRPGARAAAGSGVVRVDGVRWNATGPAHLANGESVRITNVDQLTVTVEPAAAATQTGERNT